MLALNYTALDRLHTIYQPFRNEDGWKCVDHGYGVTSHVYDDDMDVVMHSMRKIPLNT